MFEFNVRAEPEKEKLFTVWCMLEWIWPRSSWHKHFKHFIVMAVFHFLEDFRCFQAPAWVSLFIIAIIIMTKRLKEGLLCFLKASWRISSDFSFRVQQKQVKKLNVEERNKKNRFQQSMRNEIFLRRNAFGAKKFYEKSFLEDCENMFFALSFIYWISYYNSCYENKRLYALQLDAEFRDHNFNVEFTLLASTMPLWSDGLM